MKRLWSVLIVFTLVFLMMMNVAAASSQAEMTALKAGDTGDAVVQLQQRLQKLELTGSAADGIYGKQTTAAVMEAQRLLALAGHQVNETGDGDAETLALIFDPNAEDTLRTLCQGSKGAKVSLLQGRLIDLKMLDDSADGAYGQKTVNAVMQFQNKMISLGATDISTDGIASPKLQALLASDLSAYNFVAPIYFDTSSPLSLTQEYLYAKSAIVIDAPSGEILFEYNADTISYPASTTKILTLLVALEYGNIDEVITIPESAADIPKDSSVVPVYPGEEMSMRNLLHGLMIRSGNDAANAVAEIDAGSVDAFVARMNQKAAELGMSNSSFVNPHGYHDASHYTTAKDLAMVARAGLTDPTFCEIVTSLSYTMPQTSLRGPLQVVNQSEIFNPASQYYIYGAAGIKSGYTSAAGFCYVGAAQRDGKTLVAVLFGAQGRNRGWQDLSKLFEYGFAKQ
ncbi:MAG: hypothetical protein GX096_04250 [Clostridiales bacterium]|nr:hypothetical protein [Clostridiales bacterium]